MKLQLTVPMTLRGKSEMLDALQAVEANRKTKDLLRPILEIVKQALSTHIQQEFFAQFELYQNRTDLPQQGKGDLRIALDLSDVDIEAARGELINVAMAGSEWIWQNASNGQAAATFEVLCDILEEALAPADQQALLDANIADLAG